MNSKSLQSVGKLIIILFFTLICLVIGIQIGVVFNRNFTENAPSVTPTYTAAPVIQPETNQNNFLIVYVDRIQANRPELKGVWLVVGIPGEFRYTFLPIFPSTGSEASEINQGISGLFSIEEDGSLSTQFLNELRKYNYFWNHFHLIDDIGIITIYDQLASSSNRDMSTTGSQILAEMQNWRNSPENTITQQHQLFAEICDGVSQVRPEANIIQILELNPEHLSTDIGDEKIIFDWSQIKMDPSRFQCEFPSLN